MSTLFLEIDSRGLYYLSLFCKNADNVGTFKANKYASYSFIVNKLLELLLTAISKLNLTSKNLNITVSGFPTRCNLK